MKTKWRDVITDDKERLVFETLEDPQWDFRTISGIANSIDLSEEEVATTLSKFPNLVHKSIIPDVSGDDLYRLAERESSAWEMKKAIKTFITKST